MKLYKKLFDAQLNYTNDVLESSKILQIELRRINKLWDKTESMRFTLYSKNEILKLLDAEIYDFNYCIQQRTSLLMTQISDILKSETPGSNE